MAWITTVGEDEATGQCAEVYDTLREAPAFMGSVPNIYKSLSQRPEVLDAFHRLSTAASFGGSGLAREEEEMISTVVSAINQCHY